MNSLEPCIRSHQCCDVLGSPEDCCPSTWSRSLGSHQDTDPQNLPPWTPDMSSATSMRSCRGTDRSSIATFYWCNYMFSAMLGTGLVTMTLIPVSNDPNKQMYNGLLTRAFFPFLGYALTKLKRNKRRPDFVQASRSHDNRRARGLPASSPHVHSDPVG